MRGAMLFAAGLFAGLAAHVAIAQSANGGVVMMNHLGYMHISKNTLLELNPANAQRPAGFTHYGLHVENAADAVAWFKKSGVTVSDTNVSDTKAILANITDPYMGRIELAELAPDSLHYKAIQSWK